MTTVYFVRHAQPDLCNHDDQTRALSEKGLMDRAWVTAFFDPIRVDAVYSSPFQRAYDTVWELAQAKQLPIIVADALRERRVSDGWIEDFNGFVKRQWEDFSYHLPGGECLREVQQRNLRFLQQLLSAYKGKTVVIGSHGTALSTVLNHYTEFGYADFMQIKDKMPWIVRLTFEDERYISLQTYELS